MLRNLEQPDLEYFGMSRSTTSSDVVGERFVRPRAGEELLLASLLISDDQKLTFLTVPGIRCGGCISAIETVLGNLSSVDDARVNLTTKRVKVRWHGDRPPPLIETLTKLGYEAHLSDASGTVEDPVSKQMLRALAVAGFAAMNIMLLSVSVWSGADAETRGLFHWISAAIAFPAIAYSGRIYFVSAWQALRQKRTNMDVPISIGVALAFCLSVSDTLSGREHVYFDASVTLVFFLLIGRTLDYIMRERARSAVRGLEKLLARGANVLDETGSTVYTPIENVAAGMAILLSVGERVPVDACVERGASEIDVSIVTGESSSRWVAAGEELKAGMLNLTSPLVIRAQASARQSFLAEMVRLMETAEDGRRAYRRIADRVSRYYAPVVHLAAALTFLGWMMMGGDWHESVSIAISVLIVTCPCALGLAVPIVQVIAARRLFEEGILIKDGSALERLAEADTVVLDKTGTVTTGDLSLLRSSEILQSTLRLAAAFAACSNHPVAKALARYQSADFDAEVRHIDETPGQGIVAVTDAGTYRLGRAAWALSSFEADHDAGTILAKDGRCLARFEFTDELRDGVAAVVSGMKKLGLKVEMMSGDIRSTVALTAERLGISDFRAGLLPAGKVDRISELSREGRKVLMVGDGLNDAPALAAAHVSIAPATAADIGRNAADFVFLKKSFEGVLLALLVSKKAEKLVRQNLLMAVAYNVVAVPIAVLGLVTPLVAALAMSGSSLIVVANAFRLSRAASNSPTDESKLVVTTSKSAPV
jgi:Cu2+-exporting ATPase